MNPAGVRYSPWMIVAATLLTAACSGPPVRTAREAETEAIARDFMRIQYEGKDLRAAKAKYYTPDFVQHNPEIASGVHGDEKFIGAREQRNPQQFRPIAEWVNAIDHVLVDDKLFAIHHRLYTNPQDRGRVFMDIWRVENGKMVEHWDIIQPIPEAARNDNTMWGDLVKSAPPRRGDPLPEAVIREYIRTIETAGPAAAARMFVAENFRQHSPHIPDGRDALIAYFEQREAQPDAVKHASYVSHIVSDGDLVLVTRHDVAGTDDRGSMWAELFRVSRGMIVEHWDAMQPVPENSVNGNKMW